MFCKNCGNEIKNPNQQFCDKCGTPTGAAASAPSAQGTPANTPSYTATPAGTPSYTAAGGFSQRRGAGIIGTNFPVFACALIVIHAIQIILWFQKAIFASALGLEMSYSIYEIEKQEGDTIITTITIIALSIVILLNICAIIVKKIPGTGIIGILVMIWCAYFPIGMKVAIEQELSRQNFGGMLKADLTGGGWFQVILAIAAVVLYIAGMVTKKK